MNIVVVGLSHKTASVEVREKLSIPEPQIEEAIAKLRSYPHIEEIAIKGREAKYIRPLIMQFHFIVLESKRQLVDVQLQIYALCFVMYR